MNELVMKKETMNNLPKKRMSLMLSLLMTNLVACSALNVAIESKHEQALFVSFDKGLEKYEAKVDYPLEGFCLYQPSGGEAQVFLLDESAMAHQMLIEKSDSDFTLREIRSFPLPPNAEYCAVDEVSEQLFISEESIGIWSYPVRAESEIKRTVVDLIQPYGNLVQGSGPLVVVDHQLLVAEKDANLIHHYVIGDKTTAFNVTYTLPDKVKLDGLSIKSQADKLLINYLDDVQEQGYSFTAESLFSGASEHSVSAANAFPMINLTADGETQPVESKGDAADDPAIWLHPNIAEKSLILGTNKKRGLLVYDLEGNQVQQLLVGRVNNVDVRQGFTYKGKSADIAAASQRDNRSIALFHIAANSGEVSAINEITTGLDDVYGLCMYRGLEEKVYVFINDQDGRYEQYEISDSESGWSGTRVREFHVSSQPEGCTADDKNQRLFVGEENAAIWTIGAEPSDSIEMTPVAAIGDVLKADIEGMELYQTATENYLLVSSQGNDSYVLFQAQAPYEYLGRFRIVLNSELGIDGASETDGLTVTSADLGGKYPQGLVVVQDGRNLLPNDHQNFKMLSWKKISDAILTNVEVSE